MTLQRRQGLTRTPFPTRAIALRPGGPLPRYKELKPTLAVVDGSGAPVVRIGQQRRRNTGPSPATRKLVLERDGYACVCCGKSIYGQRYSLGHRLRASQGGKAVPENLLVFLGWGGEACHGRIDLYRDEADERKGYRIPAGNGPAFDPRYVPVTLFGGSKVWLTSDGRYSPEPPAGGEVA